MNKCVTGIVMNYPFFKLGREESYSNDTDEQQKRTIVFCLTKIDMTPITQLNLSIYLSIYLILILNMFIYERGVGHHTLAR